MFTIPVTKIGKNRKFKAYGDFLSNLLHRWEFDEGTSNLVSDSIGSNNGTSSGMTWDTGKVGNYSGLFSGGGEVVLTTGVQFAAGKSFTGWFKTTSGAVATDVRLVAEPVLGYSPSGSFSLGVDGGNLTIKNYRYAAGNDWVTGTGSTVNDGQWHFFAYVISDDFLSSSLYLDGANLEFTFSFLHSTFNGFTRLGRQHETPYDDYMSGNIDDIRVYDIALSEEQIQLIYNKSA